MATTALDEELTREQTAALATIDDPPLDTEWVAQAKRELVGVGKAMTRTRDELTNNLAKLSEVDKAIQKKEGHLALERRKLTETDDEGLKQEIRSRITALEKELSDLRLERGARLEAAAANREALRTQTNRVR